MKALIRDRILGIDSSGSQMGNYGPGNMLDDSTRNVWISSQYKDSVTLECNTQVNSFFVGNVRSDDIRYSYFKNPITALNGQIENEGNYVHLTLELDGDRTGSNRPFSDGDSLRVRVASDINAHVEMGSITILQEGYNKTTGKTTIFCKYPYDIPATFTTSKSIKNLISGVQVTKGVKINDVVYTTFKFPTINDKTRFTVMESATNPTGTEVHTIFYDGPSGTTTTNSLVPILDKAYSLTNSQGQFSNALTAFSDDTGFQDHIDYDNSTWNSNANNELNYKNNRWEVQEITNALLAGTTNYHPQSPQGHYIKFTNLEGDTPHESVYFRLKSQPNSLFIHPFDSSPWGGGWYGSYNSYNYTHHEISWPAYVDSWQATTNMSQFNTTSNNFLYKLSGDDIVDGTTYNFQLGRAEIVLSVTEGTYSIGDQAQFTWEQSGEINAGSGYYELKETPDDHLSGVLLSEKEQTLYTQFRTGTELATTTNLLAPNGLMLKRTGDRIPVIGDQVVIDTPPTVEFYQQNAEGNDIQGVKTATRFYRNLGDFVQGIFVDAVSVFVDVPYDDQPSKIEISFSNTNDRRLNKAMYWLKDSNEGTVTDVSLTTPPELSGLDGKLKITEDSDHDLSVGDTFVLKHVNHGYETTESDWSGDVMPGWYDSFEFNGEHYVTEVIDSTTYKSERVISPFSTQSDEWTSDIQRYRNQADDDFINIECERGGFTRGRITESPDSISSIGYGNGLAQVQFDSPHGLVDGDIIIITGSANVPFNGSQQVTYVSSYTVSFTYNTSDLGSSGTETGSLFSYKPIDLTDFGVIKVGSHLLFNNSDSIMESTQIMSIRGSGTSEDDVKVRGELASTSLDKIYTPIFGGIVKAGYSFDFPNAQIGLAHNTKDFSIKKELSTGAYHYLNRVTAKDFSGTFNGTPDQSDRFLEFAKQQMGSPFAVNVLSDMNLNVTTSFYAYFAQPPSITYNNKIDALREVSFNLKEVL